MKKLIFLMAIVLPVSIWAQISGTVLNANTNLPIADVTIVNAENATAASNAAGEFTLACSRKLRIKHVGYAIQEVSIADCAQSIIILLQPLNTQLAEVEITATSSTQKALIRQPASITKLEEPQLLRGNGLFLDDAINANIPGVVMSRRGVSSGQQFNIRGYGNGMGFRGVSSNFDMQGTKAYLNGIPLTDAEGITVLDDIDFASLGNVEVTSGPSGTLNGFAIAGVVQLKTKTAKPSESSISQNVLLGDYGLQRYTTTLQTATSKSQILLNYGNQKSDGYMAHNASTKQFVNLTGIFTPSSKELVSTFFGYANSYDERGGELTIEQYDAMDYSGNPNYIKNDAHSAVKRFRAGISYTNFLSQNIATTSTIFGSGGALNSSSAGGYNDSHVINYGLRSTLDFKYDLGKKLKINGIAGLEAQGQNAQPLSYKMVPDSTDLNGYNTIGSMKSNQNVSTSSFSYFTEWTLNLPSDISVIAGVGVNSSHIDLENRMYSGTTMQRNFEVNYSNYVSPHFAINKVFNENISVYGSYSTGQKAPVSGNIIISATNELNTWLLPEKGAQLEFGTKGQFLKGKFVYKLAVFNTRFTNKMSQLAVPLDSITTAYTLVANSGGQINNGVELALKYYAIQSVNGFIRNLSPWFNLAYSDFTYSDFIYQSMQSGNPEAVTQVYSGNPVAGVSPIVFNAGIDFVLKYGFYGNVTYQYKDAMPITSDNAFMAKAFSLVNAKVGYTQLFGKHFSLDVYAGLNNILGEQYYYMVFINQLPDAYIPAPNKLNAFGGVNLKYTL